MQRRLSGLVLLCAAIICSQTVQAQSWEATTGAQSPGKGRQALAFLPSELWIHSGDSITWTFATDEPHSVTFLKPRTGPSVLHRWLSRHYTECLCFRWFGVR